MADLKLDNSFKSAARMQSGWLFAVAALSIASFFLLFINKEIIVWTILIISWLGISITGQILQVKSKPCSSTSLNIVYSNLVGLVTGVLISLAVFITLLLILIKI